MSSLRTWLRGSAPASVKGSHEPSPAVSASTSSTAISASEQQQQQPMADKALQSEKSLNTLPFPPALVREIADMEDAMASTALLLNDDMEGAEARLKSRKDSSAFHLMGLGVATFMRSVLGFEKEAMSEANARLIECETRAWEEMRKAQTDSGSNTGWFGGRGAATSKGLPGAPASIYPPGSEYSLVHAETQIMLAVVAELHESLAEAIKGFYKLRKAFVSLNAIIESEEAYLRGDGAAPALAGSRRMSFSEDPMPGAFDDAEFADLEAEAVEEDNEAKESKTKRANGTTTTTNGTGKSEPIGKAQSDAPPIRSAAVPPLSDKSAIENSERRARQQTLDNLTNPIDVFIHSGASMCFGMLLLIISMVPPAFSRLLSIVGFKGDRERGVRMLWRSTKFANINGGMAGLALLAYYNGLIAYSDILPTDDDVATLSDPGEIVGYPKERCNALLAHMRTLYPDSLLWVLEQARLLATQRRAPEAVAMLVDANQNKVAKMRQITALTKFELALNAMCAMDWVVMRDAFLACVELNNWSHALYYYNVGCAEIELYRTAAQAAQRLAAVAGKEAEAEAALASAAKNKAAAEEHLRKAPTMAGKKKFMARQMPFDLYVIRKLARWEERAKLHGIDLADAVGVSPALEMVYLWNGQKRLGDDLLEQALTYLSWERCTAPSVVVDVFKAAPDEAAIGSLCRANLLRALGRLSEAQAILNKDILVHDRAVFKGPTKDDYVLPAATYESAVISWLQATEGAAPGDGGGEEHRRRKIEESMVLLDKVAKWEAFVLDARIGMKLQVGMDTIRWLKKKKGWTP